MKEMDRLDKAAHFIVLYFFTIVAAALVLGMRFFTHAIGLTGERVILDIPTGGFVILSALSVILTASWWRKRKTGKYTLGVNETLLFLCMPVIQLFPAIFVLWAGLETHFSLKTEKRMPSGFKWQCWMVPTLVTGYVFFCQMKVSILSEGAKALGCAGAALIMALIFGIIGRVAKKAKLPKAEVYNR